LYGEQEYPVPTLTIPEKTSPTSAESQLQFEAVRLFMERAQSNQPDFQLTGENAAAVAGICARLDGLPLAIELAAARIKLLAPPQLLARLEGGLSALGQGPRDAPARQRTLSATIDWSYDLLDLDEKRLFNRLGVFRGGWSLEALEAICSEGLSLDVFDGLATLMDKSLVRQGDGHDSELRFTLLETLREYALERLTTSGEIDKLRETHAGYFRDLCEAAPLGKDGMTQQRWLRRLQADYDNVRAAMDWAERHDPIDGLHMVDPLMTFWDLCGYLVEGLRWTERLLMAVEGAPSEIRLKAVVCASYIAAIVGERERCAAFSTEAMSLAPQVEEPMLVARAMLNLANGNVHRHLSAQEMRETREMLEGALVIFREEGDTFFAAVALNSLSELSRLSRDDDEAMLLGAEALQLFRSMGDRFHIQIVLINLGLIALRHKDYERAHALFEEALSVALHIEDVRNTTVSAEGLALTIGLTNDARRAVQLLGAAEAARQRIGVPVLPSHQPDYERHVATIRERLGADVFAAEWAAGRTLSLEQLINGVKGG
jgi:non-specific serine/threonine protein kinase